MGMLIRLTIDGKEFTATFNDNRTAEDITDMMPMELTLQRFNDHEYYSTLPKKPSVKGAATTSDAHAGGIYYYEGWNAFTILFNDAHIAPFRVVHVGDVNEDIIAPLAAAGATVEAKMDICW